MRIVSLLASATEIVCELGLADHLVGISHECDFPAHVLDRPRVSRPRFDPEGMDSGRIDRAVRDAMAEHGSVYELDADRLEALAPDLIISQAVCEVCAVPTPGVRALAAERGLGAEVLSLDAHRLEEILATIEAVGEATGSEERAGALVAGLRARLDAVAEAVADRERPTLLGIEWLDPAFVPGHWVPEMVELAGASNLAGERGARSVEVEWGTLRGLDPDALLVMPCGYGLEAAVADADRHADRLAAVAPRALADGRAWVVDASSYFNRSGPRVVRGIEILAGLLHPDAVPAPGAEEARRWTFPDR
ncbi:MAG TPA: cobalamin-binding protein [Longimicrobiales bacterium]|nr:cobalamin-binding protein [Longimicrobiales bacterium]